ncbi:hypothetical protein ABZ639_27005 [Saccharomonospora sp. NPDC006951]
MKTTRISSPEALEALFPLVDEDISTVAREEEMAVEVAEIDALIEAVDRELVAELEVAGSPSRRVFADVERVRRSQRRTVRDALSLLAGAGKVAA